MKHYNRGRSGRKKQSHSPLKFQDMAKRINVYLKEENENLDFKGYSDTVIRFFRLEDHDMYEAYEVMTECNLWSNYLLDVQNFIQLKKMMLELEVDRLNAYVEKKVPNNDLQRQIQDMKNRTKEFSVFYKQIIAQQKFFERSFWHCYRLYGKAVNTMIYKTID